MRKFFTPIIALAFVLPIIAQSSDIISKKKKPFWVKDKPISESGNYVFVVGSGTSTISLADAMKEAINEYLQFIALERGGTVETQSAQDFTQQIIKENDEITTKENTEYKASFIIDGKKVDFGCIVFVDNYYEIRTEEGKKEFKYAILFRRPVEEGLKNCRPKIDNYDNRIATNRSLIFPGLGQSYKNESKKATLYKALTITALGGIAVSQIGYSRYRSKMSTEPYYFNQNKQIADAFNYGRIGSLASLAIIYGLNVIDANTSKGRLPYLANINITPDINRNYGQLCVSINF